MTKLNSKHLAILFLSIMVTAIIMLVSNRTNAATKTSTVKLDNGDDTTISTIFSEHVDIIRAEIDKQNESQSDSNDASTPTDNIYDNNGIIIVLVIAFILIMGVVVITLS